LNSLWNSKDIAHSDDLISELRRMVIIIPSLGPPNWSCMKQDTEQQHVAESDGIASRRTRTQYAFITRHQYGVLSADAADTR